MTVVGNAATLLLLAAMASTQAGERLPEPLSLERALAIGSEHSGYQPLETAFAFGGAGESGASGRAGTVDFQEMLWRPLRDSGCVLAERVFRHARGIADRLRLERERHRRSLQIMGRYFDVLVADRIYARDDQGMAIAFVTMEKARERNQMGELSDLEILRAENRYAQALLRRSASGAAQLASRAKLAEAMGRPGELSSELVEPTLDYLDREAPELEPLIDSAMLSNPRLRWLGAELESARARIAVADAGRYRADAENRTSITSGPGFRVPNFQGACGEGDATARRSQFIWKQKELADAESEVRQAVLENWQRVTNKRLELRARHARLDYRELYLDRSRAMYDLEIRTDLGDAMVQLTGADVELARTRYDLAIAWKRLEVLTGMSLTSGNRDPGG